ncbi:DivIVA domain-containing protein [Micromonospora chalcea]
MDLHRSRLSLGFGAVVLAFGFFVLLCVRSDGTFRLIGSLVLGGLSLLIGGMYLFDGLRPFRFRITFDGLTVRTAGLNRFVPWTEIDHLVLDQPPPVLTGNKRPSPVLLLVPAGESTIDLPLAHRSPLDDRSCLALLDLDDVREKPDEVAAALAQYGGSRFTDYRQVIRQRFDSPDFSFGLRGYDPAVVNALIRKGQEALASNDMMRRFEAMAEIERSRDKLPAAARGYNRAQVDAFLADLATALARWKDDEGDAG